MQDITVGICLGLLIIMQWFVIWECIRMKGHVSSHSMDLQTSMGDMGTLLDEALDFLAENIGRPNDITSSIAQTMPDMKEMILGALMSKITNAPDHGTSKEERQISENEETNE